MSFSYWEQKTFIGNPDVCIIGGGIVGLNAAISLKSRAPQLKILVLERGSLPSGASTKNAGFACYGSISELLMDLNSQSESEVFSLVERRWKGLLRLREMLGDEMINYESLGGYEVFRSADADIYEKCASQIEKFNQKLHSITGIKSMYIRADHSIERFGFAGIKHMIVNSGEGQLDTGMMMDALITRAFTMGIKMINGITVKEYFQEGNKIRLQVSPDDHITCSNLLITTNGFAKELLPELDVQAARAQVLVTTPINGLAVRGSFHYDGGYYYFRNIDNRVLLGGGRNLAFEEENTSVQALNPMIQNHLEQLLREMILPNHKPEIEFRWTGIMGLGPSKQSIIRKITSNVWCAVRLGGMGVAIGNLIAEEAADMIFHEI